MIVIAFDLVKFIEIVLKTSPQAILSIKERTSDKINRITEEFRARIRAELAKEKENLNSKISGILYNVLP